MSTEDEVISALDQEARKRREEVNVKAAQPLPKVVRSIESTSVIYTVDPDILPFSLIDPTSLVSKLEARFGLKFRKPAFNANALEALGIDTTKMTDDGILRFLLQGDQPMIAFQNGRYPTGPDSFVFIEGLQFNRENIAATVRGITDVAQLVVAEAFAIFWESAGVSLRWDDPKVKENIDLISFATVTNLNLGTDAESLIHPTVRTFFDKEIPGQSGFGASMLPMSAFDGFKPNAKVVSSWTFDQLVVTVHSFDPKTGRSNTARLDFDTTAKGDRGQGIVEMSSELPFDEHVRMAEGLRDSLLADAKDKK